MPDDAATHINMFNLCVCVCVFHAYAPSDTLNIRAIRENPLKRIQAEWTPRQACDKA